MGHPPKQLVIGIPQASFDGKYYGRYPLGNKPHGAALAGGGVAAASTLSALNTAIKLAGSAIESSAASASLTTSSGGGAGTIAAGAGFKLVSFENLASGALVGDWIYDPGYQSWGGSNGHANPNQLVGWGNQGTSGAGGDWTNRSGCYGDTSSAKRAGKTSCLRLAIAALTSGRPADGDGPCIIDGKQGDYGFFVTSPISVLQGGHHRFGMWVKYPSTFLNTSNSGYLKTFRIAQRPDPGGFTDVLQINGAADIYAGSGKTPINKSYGWYFDTEASHIGGYPIGGTFYTAANGILADGNWHWCEHYTLCSQAAAGSIRRFWIDNVLIFEYLNGATLKYLNESGAYSTVNINRGGGAVQGTMPGGITSLDHVYLHTYYNGGSTVDQSSYCAAVVQSHNNENASDLVVDAFGNKMIGMNYV